MHLYIESTKFYEKKFLTLIKAGVISNNSKKNPAPIPFLTYLSGQNTRDFFQNTLFLNAEKLMTLHEKV